MDAERFDAMAKVLSSAVNRRGLLRGFLGGALAGVLGREPAEAKKNGQNKHKRQRNKGRQENGPKQQKRHTQKVKKKREQVRPERQPPCVPGGPCTKQPDCCPTERCIDAICVAGPGTTQASCVATGCPASTGNQCTRYACNDLTAACEIRNLDDGTGCNDGNACTENDTCQAGVCTPGQAVACPGRTCQVGTCDPASGDCTYLTTPENTACGTGHICCGGACVSNTTNTLCGTCGNRCGANRSCIGGQCVCTNSCPSSQVHNPETCACECPPGMTECAWGAGTECFNLQTAEDHCGACGHACRTDEMCVEGVCGENCPPGSIPGPCWSYIAPGERLVPCCTRHPGCPEGTVARTRCGTFPGGGGVAECRNECCNRENPDVCTVV